jgi:hypothetical protein
LERKFSQPGASDIGKRMPDSKSSGSATMLSSGAYTPSFLVANPAV